MNFYEFFQLLESKELNVRWMIRRDMPGAYELIGKLHPAFTEFYRELEPNEVPDDTPLGKIIINALRQRNCIGMVASELEIIRVAGRETNYEENIVGVMLYFLEKKMLVVPVLIGLTEEVIERLIKKLLPKIEIEYVSEVPGEPAPTGRQAIFIKVHWDIKTLNVLKKLGFTTQPSRDWIIASKTRFSNYNIKNIPDFEKYEFRNENFELV